LVQGIIAGGDVALRSAVEGAEDDEQLGKKDFKRLDIQPVDVVIGISASGHAPYVVAAMQAARENGCYTACITGVSSSRLAHAVEQPIVVNVGAEVIAGSTRMKAGTAQKLVLNMLTTGAMIQTGKTYENLMVDLRPTNSKLRQRATRIVTTLGQVNPDKANQLLSETGFEVKTAVLMARYPLSVESAREQLLKASGKLRLALKLLAG
jgi:N-acetylmuramic acid 6-phosphate etherase